MSAQLAGRVRKRGSIRQRGDTFQVRLFAGNDVVTGRQQYLTETVQIAPAKTQTAKERAEREAYAKAERVLTRFQAKVDEQRQARTKATLRATMEEWLRSHDIAESTQQGYEGYLRLHISPALGDVPLGKLTAKMLENFYAELRRCRLRCDRRPFIEHRVEGEHECRVVRHRWPPGRPTAKVRREHDCAASSCKVTECPPHVCQPLAAQTIRQIHFAISSALSAAVRWDWITNNPADVAKKPRQPKPQPKPPAVEQVARIVNAAWEQDDHWGTLVWLVMVTGMRRGEVLGLRWADLGITGDNGALTLWDTKTGDMRRVHLDPVTVDVLHAHRSRYEQRLERLSVTPPDRTDDRAFVFSYQPTHDRPCDPSGVTHRYSRMCAKLGIDSHLHALRHYSATELLTSGVDVRAVAGRLGHADASTTLRFYVAWVTESDRRAADILGSRIQPPAQASGR